MFKYKAKVIKAIVVHGRVWYPVDSIVDVETNASVIAEAASVNVRVSSYVAIEVDPAHLEIIEGSITIENTH